VRRATTASCLNLMGLRNVRQSSGPTCLLSSAVCGQYLLVLLGRFFSHPHNCLHPSPLPSSRCRHLLTRPAPCSPTQTKMARPRRWETLPVVAFLLHLVVTSSSEVCVAHVSIDTFNITTPLTAVKCSIHCDSDLLCGGSAIGSTIPYNTDVALPDVQRIFSALWEFGTWSSEVLAEINHVVWHVVRETDPTVVTNRHLCLLAMCMHDWWALHPHRSKNHLSPTDVILVSKGLDLVVVGQLLGLLVCIKMLPHVAVVEAVHASMITPIANVAAVVMTCVGLYMLAFDLHFALPLCAALSLAYWCSALWIGLTMSTVAGVALAIVAVAMRRSVMLFPRETPPPTHTHTHIACRALLGDCVGVSCHWRPTCGFPYRSPSILFGLPSHSILSVASLSHYPPKASTASLSLVLSLHKHRLASVLDEVGCAACRGDPFTFTSTLRCCCLFTSHTALRLSFHFTHCAAVVFSLHTLRCGCLFTSHTALRLSFHFTHCAAVVFSLHTLRCGCLFTSHTALLLSFHFKPCYLSPCIPVHPLCSWTAENCVQSVSRAST
jgi:hypothetical protein